MGADGLDVEADEFAASAVAGFLEDADLVEGRAEVGSTEVLILIVFQAVLVVQVDARKKLARSMRR